MEHVKRSSLVSLIVANVVAFAVLVLPVNAVRAQGDYCPAGADGCDCWDGTDPETGVEWSPSGCYDMGELYLCHGAAWCED
jgi:hypothetical protein